MKYEITKEQIQSGLNDSYKQAGATAYYGTGFRNGIDFLFKHIESLSNGSIIQVQNPKPKKVIKVERIPRPELVEIFASIQGTIKDKLRIAQKRAALIHYTQREIAIAIGASEKTINRFYHSLSPEKQALEKERKEFFRNNTKKHVI